MGDIRSHSSEINDYMGVRGVSSPGFSLKLIVLLLVGFVLKYLTLLSVLLSAVAWRLLIFLTGDFCKMYFKINIQVVLWCTVAFYLLADCNLPLRLFHISVPLQCHFLVPDTGWTRAVALQLLDLSFLSSCLFSRILWQRDSSETPVSLSDWAESNQLIQKLLEMHAHAHHDHICIIFEGSQAEKIKSDLIRDRCIIMFHGLEKITLLYGWSWKYALPQLTLVPLW